MDFRDEGKLNIQTAFITLAAENLSEVVAFYQAFFQQAPTSHRPNRYAEFSLPGCKLALFQPSSNHRAEFAGGAASMSICLEVDDLAGAIATLTNVGYPPPGEIIHASHGQEIYAYDPAGNRLILHQTSAPSPSD
ncbi:VOC family protein [Leptothoe kymatousa]|uniref:VOC domain-containing protein n=1 Tax=Leptothoe kymatousa TAU-MAC 1615 TaxID=2364775 RepID=A0ABS5Y4V1_9CYAN|nr:VOC family protein [Leptothoe kymatousa]MBT9312870.1 hypothetical protein [Leptothoe kymatousa TAU-MAC 1615]